jgi:hypothetical protein
MITRKQYVEGKVGAELIDWLIRDYWKQKSKTVKYVENSTIFFPETGKRGAER